MKKQLMVLAVGAVLSLAACGGQSSSSQQSSSESSSVSSVEEKYEREENATVFARQLGKFSEYYDGVSSIAETNERFVKYAKAEAELLSSGLFAPTTTRGGIYSMSRVAPRTIPYVFFGNDSDKIKTLVMTKGEDKFIKGTEREELKALWEKAKAGEGTYDPAAYLQGKGYEIGTEYATTTSAAPATLDSLATSKQVDTEEMVNCVEGLIQYNNLGVMVPAMAESWEANEDSTKFTFTIRSGAKWYNANKQAVADVTADDFVAGFQHMLDAKGGLAYLVDGIVKGVHEYLTEGGSFDDVGVYVEDGKLVFELDHSESFFMTRLAYSCFLPMNRAFFLSQGGAFGLAEFAEAAAKTDYTYGKGIANVLYNSAFIPTTWDLSDSGGSIVLAKNENYWDAANVSVTKAQWNYDDGKNPNALYAAARSGQYPGINLGEASGLLKKSKDDNMFDDYHFITDTEATTFFGGFNVNRGAFDYGGEVKSTQNEHEKILTHNAVQSKNFRRAFLHGWDRGTWNAASVGDELKYNSLRNMYTQPEFVSLDGDVTVDGKEYKKGTSYGDLVQSFLDAWGDKIKVEDGQDGWFNKAEAKKFMAAAREELKDVWAADEKVVIDMVYYSGSPVQIAQSKAFEELVEGVFPNDIDIRLVEATTTAQYYYSGYYAETGADVNQDIFYGSGWGPDYGDPSTYLDTFAEGGYMTVVLGLLD